MVGVLAEGGATWQNIGGNSEVAHFEGAFAHAIGEETVGGGVDGAASDELFLFLGFFFGCVVDQKERFIRLLDRPKENLSLIWT